MHALGIVIRSFSSGIGELLPKRPSWTEGFFGLFA